MKIWTVVRFVAVVAPMALGGCAGLSQGGDGLAALTSYERGKFHYAAGHYGLAVNHFQTAVDRNPASVVALNGLAATYDQLGRFDLSARYYGRALAANPDSTQTLNNIGYSYLMQKRFDLSVAYLRDAYTRDRNDTVVLANRRMAEVSLQEADLKRAAEPEAEKKTEVARARPPRAEKKQVKPWIERTASTVQTLVTEPQLVLVDMAEDAGVSPQLAAFRPKQPEAGELLLQPMASPIEAVSPASTTKLTPLAPAAEGASLAPVTEVEIVSMAPAAEAAQPMTATEVVSPMATTEVAALVIEEVELTVGGKAPDVPSVGDPIPLVRFERTPAIEVSNGTGRLRMAARMRAFLGTEGVDAGRLTNANHYSHMETTIFYRDGWKHYAEYLARILPAIVDLSGNDDQAADIRVELGADLLDFDRDMFYADRKSSHDHSS
ncbi:MAG: tetratricopeptide repeat protein [Kiloniellales bacterium]